MIMVGGLLTVVMQSMNKGGHPCSGCIIVECISRGGVGGSWTEPATR